MVANFSLNNYNVTVSSGVGGSVSGGGNNLNCGSSCTVTATPDDCYSFVNWTEGSTIVSTDASYSFTVSSARTLTANFSLNTYTITATAGDGGTVEGGNTYDCGATCTLVATADACHTFVNWTEGSTVVSTDASYSFTVSGARTLTANFSLNTYAITATAGDGGSVEGGNTYDCGATATLVASADACHTFVNWTEGSTVVSTDASYSFTVSGARTLTANFSLNTYAITATAGDGGSVTGSNTYDCGETATLVATADGCHNFVNWTANGVVVSTNPTYSFTVDGDRTLVANFTEWTLSLGNTPATLECINTESEVVLTASTTSDAAPTYTWAVSSGSTTGTASGNTYTVSPTALSNTYTVSATVGGCVVTASKTVTVIPTITSISSSEGNEICMGVSTNLTVTSNATSFAWDNGAGSGSSVTVTPMVNTTYTVVATENTCTAASSIAITINIPDITGYDYIWRGASTDWNIASNWYLYDGENYTVASTLPSEPNSYYIGTGDCLPSDMWPTLSADATVGNVTIESGSVTVPDGRTLSIAGSVNGTITAEEGSTIAFIGSNDQTLSDAAIFSYVRFAQTADGKKIIAPNGITVNALATFVTGVVSANVSFSGSASATGASLSSYVEGNVTKILGSAGFTFPLGSNGVLGEVDVPATRSGGTVSMRFNKSASDSGFDQENDGYPRWWNITDMCAGDGANRFHHVSNVEYWDISTTEAISGVNFRSIATSDIHFNNTSTNQRDLGAIKFALYNGCWQNMGGTAAADNNFYELSVNGVTIPATNRAGLKGSFGSTDDETLLPIELLSFTSTCNGKYAELAWTTASERNNDYFVIERSDDAINFTEVGRVAGAGNSIEQLDYTYNDYGIHGGDNYYRLWQVDYDGTRTVSDIIVATCEDAEVGEPDVQAYPNPFDDGLTIELDNFDNRPARIEVYDMLGKLIYMQKADAPQNSYEAILNLSNLPPAAYTVRVSTADFVINKQVVKN